MANITVQRLRSERIARGVWRSVCTYTLEEMTVYLCNVIRTICLSAFDVRLLSSSSSVIPAPLATSISNRGSIQWSMII